MIRRDAQPEGSVKAVAMTRIWYKYPKVCGAPLLTGRSECFWLGLNVGVPFRSSGPQDDPPMRLQ